MNCESWTTVKGPFRDPDWETRWPYVPGVQDNETAYAPSKPGPPSKACTKLSVPLNAEAVLVVHDEGARVAAGVGLAVGDAEADAVEVAAGTALTADAEPPLPLQPATAHAATSSVSEDA